MTDLEQRLTDLCGEPLETVRDRQLYSALLRLTHIE